MFGLVAVRMPWTPGPVQPGLERAPGIPHQQQHLHIEPRIREVLSHQLDPHPHGLDALEREQPANLGHGLGVPAQRVPALVAVLPEPLVVPKQLVVFVAVAEERL